MREIEEIEQETILKKDLEYFFQTAKKIKGLKNYSRFLLGKLYYLAVKKFADGQTGTEKSKIILDAICERIGVKKTTLLQYWWFWKKMKGLKDFSKFSYKDYRKLAGKK